MIKRSEADMVEDDTYYLCVLAGGMPCLWVEGVVRECWGVDEERDGGDVIYVYVPTLSPPLACSSTTTVTLSHTMVTRLHHLFVTVTRLLPTLSRSSPSVTQERMSTPSIGPS